MKRLNYSGFSLVEILVFILILGLFFVVVIAITAVSLRNMKINEHKILATRYAEELLEWLRGQKEIDWNNFVNNYSNNTYCFPNSPITGWSSPDNCSTYTGLNPPIYKRELTLSTSGRGTQVNASITVSWQELGNTYQVSINTVFSIWE